MIRDILICIAAFAVFLTVLSCLGCSGGKQAVRAETTARVETDRPAFVEARASYTWER